MKKIFSIILAFVLISVSLAAQSKEALVYFTRDISADSVVRLYAKVGKPLTGKVAVQQSMGEPGGYLFIQPELSEKLVKQLGGTYINSTGVSDTVKIRKEIAEEHGFTKVAKVDVIDENGDIELPVKGGKILKKNIVGVHLKNYDSLLVLTHFKGHAVSGIGGIMKNLSIGVSSPAGKRLIHSGGTTSEYYTHKSQTAFLEANAEAAKSVIDHFGGKVVYINFLFKLAAASDYGSTHPKTVMDDIGILASDDPVALDQACTDMIYAAKNSKALTDLFESQNGIHSIEYAEKIGLGSRKYKLIEVKDTGADMKISIQIKSDTGSHTLTASLADNSSAIAFYELLEKRPVTIKMNEYGGFEKVGPLGTSLPRSDSQLATTAGDIMLYQGKQITIFYNNNSWSYTRLGKVVSTGSTTTITQAELKKILGKGDVTAVFEILE